MADRVNFAMLAQAIRAKQGKRSLASISRESGIPAKHLKSLLEEEVPTSETFVAIFKVCAWLNIPARTFLIESPEREENDETPINSANL